MAAGLVYSGDTAPCPSLVELAQGADVLVCEAGFPDGMDNPPGLHMTGADAGEHAQAAGVRSLILTHVPPWGDPAGARTHAARASTDRWNWRGPAWSSTSEARG